MAELFITMGLLAAAVIGPWIHWNRKVKKLGYENNNHEIDL